MRKDTDANQASGSHPEGPRGDAELSWRVADVDELLERFLDQAVLTPNPFDDRPLDRIANENSIVLPALDVSHRHDEDAEAELPQLRLSF
jgi:hypothetical protein